MSDTQLLAAYLATRWTVGFGRAALVLRPGTPAPAGLGPAGIVTAWNPASQRLTPQQNQRADLALRHRIRALGLTVRRALAQGADPAWNEPGWLLSGVTLAALVELGAAFGQNAVVWIDLAGTVRVVASRDGFCGVAAGTPLG